MTLDEIITLFKAIEANGSPSIGFHLHGGLNDLNSMRWHTNQNYGDRFSDFLTALKEAESPIYDKHP